jgi:hypothetical protein
MYYSTQASFAMPTANIAVNKSRLKVYNNVGPMPTYYLQKGQEFQIELFNPTQDVVLAKISLNNKAISQGGLVLNPGQRVFLDRYIDVAKKFLFDTYEVSGQSEEVKKAIENNGDIKVEFYRERQPINYGNPIWINGSSGTITTIGSYNTGTDPQYLRSSNSGNLSGSLSTQGITSSSAYYNSTDVSNSIQNTSFTSSVSNEPTMDWLSMDVKQSLSDEAPIKNVLRSRSFAKKSIETGRVEAGSSSDQKFTYVDKKFEYTPFFTVSYKLLPVSQKVNTVADIQVKRYCTQCGAKTGKTDRFCSSCGTKI